MRASVVADKIVDDDALERADLRAFLGAAQAGAKAPEERRADDIAHGDVGDGNIFAECSVFAFESKPHATVEDAVGDGDVLEATIGFGATLDAAIACETWHIGGELLVRAVKHGAQLVGARDVAVGDGHVLGGAVVAESVAGLRADGVIPRGVDEAVGDADVAAAVDVDAVAVCVDGEVVDGEIVDSGEEEAEVTAFEDGEVAEDDIAAVLECDGFVAYTGLLSLKHRVVAARRADNHCAFYGASRRVGGRSSGRTSRTRSKAEAFAEDEAGAGDGDVVDALTPDERVVPVIVAVVLIGIPCGVQFGCVVGAAVVAGGCAGQRRVGGENGRALREVQPDVTLEANGEAEPGSGREEHSAAARCCRGFDRLVDRRGIDSFAVANSAVGAYVEDAQSPFEERRILLRQKLRASRWQRLRQIPCRQIGEDRVEPN